VGLEKESSYDLVVNEEHVNAAANDTFDKSGIAKNSREEKIRARDAKLKQDAENAKMAALYRKEVLGEKAPEGGFVPLGAIGGLGGITPAPKASNVEVVTAIEETVSGD
jgi:7,8-dihydro-6-hydroxymethylpterin dimethyltransferase